MVILIRLVEPFGLLPSLDGDILSQFVLDYYHPTLESLPFLATTPPSRAAMSIFCGTGLFKRVWVN
jgi:hypothetical protein